MSVQNKTFNPPLKETSFSQDCWSCSLCVLDDLPLPVFRCDVTETGCGKFEADSAIELLVEAEHLPALEVFIAKLGFTRTSGFDTAEQLILIKYQRLCMDCGLTVRLQVSTKLHIFGTSGPRLIFHSSSALHNLIQSGVPEKNISLAINTIRIACEAALDAGFFICVRRSLLVRSRECLVAVARDDFVEASEILVGRDATNLIVALLSTTVRWEIELFLTELRRELRSSSKVTIFRQSWLKRIFRTGITL